MPVVTVERFKDPRYAHHRYRLRYLERQSFLRNGFTCASYKFKRDAMQKADEINVGYFAALAIRDKRYTIGSERNPQMGLQFAVRFLGERIGTARDSLDAWRIAGEHLADLRLIPKDNPNRRPPEAL